MKLAGLFLAAFLFGILLVYFYHQGRTLLVPKPVVVLPTPIPTLAPFSINTPPSESLRGNIASMSGDVEWQSRTATEAAKINSLAQIQQGEVIKTDESGKVNIVFPNVLTINISPGTEVNFAQTLPTNLVFGQSMGTVNYSKLNNYPLSVRALHLLINQSQGSMSVKVDPDNSEVIVDILSGSATLGFNDTNNITNLENVASGKEAVFDDQERALTVVRQRL